MLFEIEQKVSYLSELSVHSESLLLEGRAETKGEAEQLTFKLHSLKDSLMELQQMLQDKQVGIQVRSEVICGPWCSPVHLTLHTFSNVPAFPSSLPLCDFCCAVLHCMTPCTSINGGIVQILKVVSCSFIKVCCFPLWNNKSLCWQLCTAAGVVLMTQHFGFGPFWGTKIIMEIQKL